ncbi:nucleoporin-domain-containing protein [Xylariomycetidae sp. FL2044]|nr:nucleoporin-domain-containing protein [Xylariomycetidae sp. FL2044]
MSFPQTPGHNLPGAFLNTPAVASRFSSQQQDPTRRLLFGQKPSAPNGHLAAPISGLDAPVSVAEDQLMRSQQPSPMPPQPPLAKAASYINNNLSKDEHYPELDKYCRQISSDYELASANSDWAPFRTTRSHEIPQRVLEQYNRAEVSTMMGLFAELNHAWVTIDNCLYLWDYTRSSPELIGYEDSPHSITAVKLVPPKPGVFNPVITHILAVATTSEIFLLGVSAKRGNTGAMDVELYGTKMSLRLGSTEVRTLAGSANGRIFFSAQTDSDIYELYYQQEEKWFSSRTGKINHTYPGWSAVVPKPSQIWAKSDNEHIVDIVVDDSRNLLYSLSNTSTVRTYYMEAPDRLTKVIEKTKQNFLQDIAHTLSLQSPLLSERMNIVSISPISAIEDHRVHLMALTDTGCRLFMNATSASSYMLNLSSQVPQSMQLQSIKFPPSDVARRRTRTDAFGNLHEFADVESRALEISRWGVRLAPGYFLDFVTKADHPNSDALFISAPDCGRIRRSPANQNPRYYEHANWLEIGSKAEDVGLISKPFAATNQPLGFGNELAVQFDDPTGTEFAVLTNTGVHIIRRRRLVDIFASVIRSAAGEDGLKKEVAKFQNAYGKVETITAALAVACRQGENGRYTVDQATIDRAIQVFVTYGGSPTIPDQDAQTATVEMVRPSKRHAALTLYLSRLLRSLWRSKVITLATAPTGAFEIQSPVPDEKLRAVQDSVQDLRNFLEQNRAFIQGLSGPADLRRAGSKQEELAFQGEHQAMKAVEVLMTGIIEGIAFVRTLFDERVTDIFTRLDDASRQELKDLTYEGLFSQPGGKELAKVLVKAIVNRNIENGSNVETVADALRRKCGSFCSPDDVVIFKAQEQLKRASDPAMNPTVSRSTLRESLSLFQKVAGSLTHANLESAVQQYVNLRYYAGAIQLCLTVAHEKDRGNSALTWINDGRPDNDPRSKAFESRKTCYSLIHDVLRNLDATASQEPEMIDGRPTLFTTKRNEAYDVVNSSTDEVFHFDLYDWYIQQGWTDRLLHVDSPHVITFLRRLAAKDFNHADLLCRFHTMRNEYFQAAKVQAELAQSDFAIGIKERVTLLSKAKTNASVMTTGVSRQEQQLLNHEVTELLEVANIQDDLLERLTVDPRIAPEKMDDIRRDLDGKIHPLSELYNSYADPAEYYDLCLIIYHAADYKNPTTIFQTWDNLIQQTHDEVVAMWEKYNNKRLQVPLADTPPHPYEKLCVQIQEICHRAGNDSAIFPVSTLLPELCRYAYENGQDARINAEVSWPIMLFLNLGVSHDMIAHVLERMFEAQEVPFRGPGRIRVAEWVIFVVRHWVRELSRHGRPESRLEPWVAELLRSCEQVIRSSNNNVEGGTDPTELAREVRELLRTVDGMTLPSMRGSTAGFW